MELERRITRPLTIFLALSFLATVGAVPLAQAVLDAVAGELGAYTELRSLEEDLEERSFLRNLVLPRIQSALSGLGAGNEQVYLGLDGWLFYRADVDHVTGPGFLAAGDEPVRALIDLHAQLKERGVDLLVVPVPVKPTIHPEKLSRAYAGAEIPTRNPSFEAFASALAESGVELLDLAPALLAHKRPERPAYLATDTHWTPAAVRVAAAAVADRVRRRHPDLGSTEPAGVLPEMRVVQLGDTARMLATGRWPRETVRLEPMVRSGSGPAPVLLLGDSFANIYSLESMGWGNGAGLAEQLGRELGVPVEAVTRNDGGALAVRAALARRLARDGAFLRGTKVVVYEFAARELSQGDWRSLTLPVW